MRLKSLNTALRIVWLRTQCHRLWHWLVLHDCVMPALILMNCAVLGMHIWLSRDNTRDIIKYWDGAVYGATITLLSMWWMHMRAKRRREIQSEKHHAAFIKQMETHMQSVLNELIKGPPDDPSDDWKKSDTD